MITVVVFLFIRKIFFSVKIISERYMFCSKDYLILLDLYKRIVIFFIFNNTCVIISLGEDNNEDIK